MGVPLVAGLAAAVGLGAVLVGVSGEDARGDAAPGVTAFAVGGAPSQVALAGGLVWTLDLTARRIVAIDPEHGRRVHTLSIGARQDFATDLTAGAGAVWVTLGSRSRPSFLTRIDPATGRMRHHRLERSVPQHVAVGPDSTWLLDEDRLSRLEHRPAAGQVRPRPVRVLSGAVDVATGYGATWVVRRGVTEDGAGRSILIRIDQSDGRVAGRRTVPGPATALATGLGAVWIANGCAGGWLRAPVGAGPARCTRSGGGLADIAVGRRTAWAADHDGSALLRLDPHTGAVLRRVALSTRPAGVAVGEGAAWAVSRRGVVYRVIDPTAPGPAPAAEEPPPV